FRCLPRLPSRSSLFPYTTLFRSVHVEHVVMRHERLGERASVARLQDRRLDLDEALLVEEPADCGDDARAQDEVLARLLVHQQVRSEEHTLNSSHVAISYAVFCLK